MDSVKLSENICRICLKNDVILNWNDYIFEFSEISYKHCYYKYTKLDETDSDCYPSNLCEICGNGLKNAHMLFEKAVESFDILQALLKTKQVETKYSDIDICNSLPTMKYEDQGIHDVDNTMDDKAIMERDDEISSPLHGSERVTKIESPLNNDEMTMTDVIIEPGHFIDIQNYKSSAAIELPQSSPTNKTRNKRKKCDSIPAYLLDEVSTGSCNNKLRKSPTTKKACKRKKKPECLPESALQQQHDVISLVQNITESCGTNSPLPTKPAKKSREKYLLMCAYCSLKVEGARKLEKHEATHSENRKRTEACPQCGVKLYTKLALSEHMKIHDKNRQKNHKCEFCEKAFFNKGALNVHRRIHLGLMVKCQICSKEFFRQVDLDKHLLKHSASPLEKNVGKKKYAVQCQYCNKSVLTDKLKEHIAAHLDQPQVKCKICDKNFFARSKCTKHLKQVHHKNCIEYEEFIHYYVDRNKRMSSLMMKQQFSVQPLKQ